MKKLFCLLTIMLCSNVALAANWMYIGEDTSSYKHYIDKSSIKKNNGNVKFWIKNKKTDDPPIKDENDQFVSSIIQQMQPSGRVLESISLVEISCTNEKYRVLSNKNTITNGYLPPNNSIYPSSWSYISPESMAETASNKLCKK